MEEVKIDKDIPVPYKQRVNKYPFKDMEVGDSFFIAVDIEESPRKKQQQFSGLCVYYSKRFNKKFLSRTTKGGIRIWRVKIEN